MIEIGLAVVMFFVSVWLFCIGVAAIAGSVMFVLGLIWLVIASPMIFLVFIFEGLANLFKKAFK